MSSRRQGAPGWWARRADSRDRAARRAYRRSLPPLYRWRRVLIGILVAALGIAGLFALGQDPVKWVIDQWYDLRKTTVAVPVEQVTVDPPDATANGSQPAAVTDQTVAAWTMNWHPEQEGTRCGGAPGTGVLVLTVTSSRIRQIDFTAGLPATAPERELQARPKAIGVSFDDGPCHQLNLKNAAESQTITVDSGKNVTTVRIGVDTSYAAPEGGKPLLSFTEVVLKSRPR